MAGDADLRRLAAAAGVELGYWDYQGRFRDVDPESLRAILAALGVPAEDGAEAAERQTTAPATTVVREGEPITISLHPGSGAAAHHVAWRLILETGDVMAGEAPDEPALDGGAIERRRLALPDLPFGYHRLHIEFAGATRETSLIVVPAACWAPDALLEGRRRWGVCAQIYGLRSPRNWGVGDFADLGDLASWAASRGADLIGVNPLHARFPREPERISPYFPSSRLHLDPLYIDAEAMPDLSGAPGLADLARKAAAARSGELIDYEAASSLKQAAFEGAYARFSNARAQGGGDGRFAGFQRFQREGGETLLRFALYEAIAEAQRSYDWPHWPEGLRSPARAEVSAFAKSHESRVEFFQYLQWQAELQLTAAAERARGAGMTIGLYRDLAVGCAPEGADTWSEPGLYASSAELGAPPDPFNTQGQAWGVAPPQPGELQRGGYAHFASLLRANMRRAGALRIDHVMGLQRLFWIPRGAPAAAGAYVRYPLEDLLGVLALESHRNRCLVVGEDLGTVPDGFRPRMAEARVLSCRVLWFEREAEAFRAPADYPVLAASCVSTHDLATLAGFWSGADLAAMSEARQFETDEALAQARSERRRDKRALLEALGAENLLAPAADLDALIDGPMSPELAAAIHAYVARTPSLLATAQLEDLAGNERQANLPGATSEYPSWRRRASMALADLARDPSAAGIVAAIARERTRGAEPALDASSQPSAPNKSG
jgi:4-alpha-glucanotransferase